MAGALRGRQLLIAARSPAVGPCMLGILHVRSHLQGNGLLFLYYIEEGGA